MVGIIFALILWWGNWGSEGLSNLSKVMELQSFDLMGQEFNSNETVLKEVKYRSFISMEIDLF